ncbi:pilin protein [Selenomonas sp.]|uniref:pilin protein n=1 Tax=Selenomonas sp. TaxID=2053611 RepID=UPI0025E75F01|nr:pilin protein [Selenomonas sp.]
MLQKLNKFFTQKGQGIVEYALILAFVAAIAAVALGSDTGLGNQIKGLFTSAKNNISTASTP